MQENQNEEGRNNPEKEPGLNIDKVRNLLEDIEMSNLKIRSAVSNLGKQRVIRKAKDE